jgi:hypothetical protein
MKLRWVVLYAAVAATPFFAAAAQNVDGDPNIIIEGRGLRGDPRAIPQPSPFGRRPWVRWDCNADRSNCLVQRRYLTRVQCVRARNLYLAQTRWRWAKCTEQ